MREGITSFQVTPTCQGLARSNPDVKLDTYLLVCKIKRELMLQLYLLRQKLMLYIDQDNVTILV